MSELTGLQDVGGLGAFLGGDLAMKIRGRLGDRRTSSGRDFGAESDRGVNPSSYCR